MNSRRNFDLGPDQAGFTLMELTVVLVIVALLLGGLLIPLGAQRDVDFMRTTEKSLTDIREALIGFAIINGRLPCPAQATIASGSAGAGIEATTGSGTTLSCACTAATSPGTAAYLSATACSTALSSDVVGGVLPWATLGLLETDAWSNRFTYQVSTFFARGIDPAQTLFGATCTPSTTPAGSAFALCTPGGISILTAASGATLASTVPAVVISHGKNGLGAYSTFGIQQATTGATADETENYNYSGDANFVSNTNIDDRLVWIPTTQLMNRMISAAKLP